jgi:FkbM family methyltransferase
MGSIEVSRLAYRLSPAAVRRRLQRWMPVSRFDLRLPNGSGLTFADTQQSEVFKALYWRGFEGYEFGATSEFFRLSALSRVVLDIGAYFGYYALLASRANPAAEIHAFEPVPESFALMQKLAGINAAQIACHRLSLSDRDGVATFYLPDRSLSAIPNIGSLINRFGEGRRFDDRGSRKVEVDCRRLDSFGLAPDLIKLDVEEAELAVLQGGEATIRQHLPAIVMEVIDAEAPAVSWLQDLGYQQRRLDFHEHHRGGYGENLFLHPDNHPDGWQQGASRR